MIVTPRSKIVILGRYRVIRGGGWSDYGLFRSRFGPVCRFADLGFRIVMRKR